MKTAKVQNVLKRCLTALLTVAMALCYVPLGLQRGAVAEAGDTPGENWYIPRAEDTMLTNQWSGNLTTTDLSGGGIKLDWKDTNPDIVDVAAKAFPLDGLTMKLNNLVMKDGGTYCSLAFVITSTSNWSVQYGNAPFALILEPSTGSLYAKAGADKNALCTEQAALKYDAITGKPFLISLHKESGSYRAEIAVENAKVAEVWIADSYFTGISDPENVLVALAPAGTQANEGGQWQTMSVELKAIGPCFPWPENERRVVPQGDNMTLPNNWPEKFQWEVLSDGLKLKWIGGAQDMRAGTKSPLDLAGLVIEMSQYNRPIAKGADIGVPAFVIGGSSLPDTWDTWPDVDAHPANLTVTFDKEGNRLLAKAGNNTSHIIVEDDSLSPAQLAGKPIRIAFEAAADGNYDVEITVGSQVRHGTLPKTILGAANALTDTTSVYVSATIVTPNAGGEHNASYVLNGIYNNSSEWDLDAVTAAINAIGEVTLADGSAIRLACRLYDIGLPSEQKQVPADLLKKLTDAEAAYAALSQTADEELTPVEMANTINANKWPDLLRVTDIPSGGLRYEFLQGNAGVRDGVKAEMALDGLLLQFDNLYSAQGNGKMALFMGPKDNNNGPDYSTGCKSLVLVLDPSAGTITAYNDPQNDGPGTPTPILSSELLRYAQLAGKRFAFQFEKQEDGDYLLKVFVGGAMARAAIPTGTIPAEVISKATDFDPKSAYVAISGWGSTGQVDYLGFRHVEKIVEAAEVMAAIEAIGAVEDVRLEDGSAIRRARRLYNLAPEDEKSQVDNYDALTAAEAEYARLTAEADAWLIPMNKANALLSSNTGNQGIQDALQNGWKNWMTLTDLPGGSGLRYHYTDAGTDVREGFGRSVNLDGLTLQMDNLYGNGNFALFFGEVGGWGPSSGDAKLTLIFDTAAGTVTGQDGPAIIQNDALKYANLKEKRFAVGFEMNDDGSFALNITVNGKVLTGTISKDLIALENTAKVFVLLSAYGDKQTLDVDFLGVGLNNQTQKVIDLIDGIGLVKLDSEDALKAAQAAYEALSPARKEQIVNYKALEKAWTRWYSLEFEDMISETIEAIDAIGTVNELSGPAVREAEKLYNRLTDAQKAKVTNAVVLTEALAKYNELLKPLLSFEASMYDPASSTLRLEKDGANWWGDKRRIERPATGGVKLIWADAVRNMRDGTSQTYNLDGLRFQIRDITKETGKDGAQLSIQMGSLDNDYAGFYGDCLALVLDTIAGELRVYPGGGVVIKSDALKHSAIEGKTLLFELCLTEEELYQLTLKIDGVALSSGIIPASTLEYAKQGALKATDEVLLALSPWGEDGLSTASFSATLLSIQSVGSYAFEQWIDLVYAIDALPEKATKDNADEILAVYARYCELSRELRERITNYDKLQRLMNQIYEMGLGDFSTPDTPPSVNTGDTRRLLPLAALPPLSLAVLLLAAKRKRRTN